MSGNNAGKTKNNIHFLQQSCRCKKPIEIYVFIDPLCRECWSLEPVLKKLQLEYGDYVKIRHVISGKLTTLNTTIKYKPSSLAIVWEKTMSRSNITCNINEQFKNTFSAPFSASIAIKAAELQGKNCGLRFLRKLQEKLFIENENITKIDVLLEIAKEVELDLNEFKKDLHSVNAARAFQCDLKITSEMDVDESPTIVFFNENIEEEGLKVAGCYSYDIYVDVITHLLATTPEPKPLPDIETFLQQFPFVSSTEIAFIYNWSEPHVERTMKKLLLKQLVEHITIDQQSYWRYIEQN